MPKIRALKPVCLRKVWPNEARDFTPWLAKHIDWLGDVLNLKLERVQPEVTLPGAGRVDIRARQAGTNAIVVIENQLGESDDSHLVQLLGYAANAEAGILVWVAHSFTSYHRSILEWLNEADTIDVYAVAVRTYHVGKDWAAEFQPVVEPPQSRPTAITLWAEFYRPLVARLCQQGVQPVGKCGWGGRWRSFQTGHPGAIYFTGSTDVWDGNGMVGLSFCATRRQERFRALRRHRDAIDGKVGGTVSWEEGSWEEGSWVKGSWEEGKKEFLVKLERNEAFSLTAPEEQLETARQWMADNLLSLRDAVQPHLNEVMRAKDSDLDEVKSAD